MSNCCCNYCMLADKHNRQEPEGARFDSLFYCNSIFLNLGGTLSRRYLCYLISIRKISILLWLMPQQQCKGQYDKQNTKCETLNRHTPSIGIHQSCHHENYQSACSESTADNTHRKAHFSAEPFRDSSHQYRNHAGTHSS